MSLQWDRSVISFFSSLVPTTLGYLFKLRELVRKSGCIRSTYPLYGPRYRFDLYIVIHDVVIYFFLILYLSLSAVKTWFVYLLGGTRSSAGYALPLLAPAVSLKGAKQSLPGYRVQQMGRSSFYFKWYKCVNTSGTTKIYLFHK